MTSAPCTAEGTLPFPYQGENFQTYYKVFGDLKNKTRTPLIALHGGPGLSHDYILPIADLATTANIPVILYDQVGNGLSTHLPDKPVEFWTIDLFIDELINLISHLGISESFDLLGHSWGGALGAEFELRRQPAGLRRFIMANSGATFALWRKAFAERTTTMPEEIQEGLKAGFDDRAKYEHAVLEFYGANGCIVKPVPKEFLHSLKLVLGPDGDNTVFKMPILDGWSVIGRSHRIRVPTLVFRGRFDIAEDFVIRPLIDEIKDVKEFVFEHSTHTPFWEERDKLLK